MIFLTHFTFGPANVVRLPDLNSDFIDCISVIILKAFRMSRNRLIFPAGYTHNQTLNLYQHRVHPKTPDFRFMPSAVS